LSGSKPIVVVGSINTDLVSVTERIPLAGETVMGSTFHIYPGGKGANQAVAVARLGYPVRMIGRVGTDSFGPQSRVHLRSAGVDVELVGSSDGPSGIAVICVSSRGENSIIVTPGANASISPAIIEQHASAIRDAGAVLAQLEIPLESVEYLAMLCDRANVPLILDPAPALSLSPDTFPCVSWLTPNQREAAFYINGRSDESQPEPRGIVQELLRKGTRGVVLKLGADGAAVSGPDSPFVMVPACTVKAVDTTAAGDAFNGGFAVGLMRGMTPLESARFASVVAGISVTRAGAQPSMPQLGEVEQFIAQQNTRSS
jgi:ribokinase